MLVCNRLPHLQHACQSKHRILSYAPLTSGLSPNSAWRAAAEPPEDRPPLLFSSFASGRLPIRYWYTKRFVRESGLLQASSMTPSRREGLAIGEPGRGSSGPPPAAPRTSCSSEIKKKFVSETEKKNYKTIQITRIGEGYTINIFGK